jgi:hypothetical protein
MQRSCADVNSTYKRKCWTNSGGPLVNSLLWVPYPFPSWSVVISFKDDITVILLLCVSFLRADNAVTVWNSPLICPFALKPLTGSWHTLQRNINSFFCRGYRKSLSKKTVFAIGCLFFLFCADYTDSTIEIPLFLCESQPFFLMLL